MIFLVLSGKMIFLFPENMILLPENEWWSFSKKIHRNMIFSSNVLKRWSFQKGSRWYMIFFVLSEKVIFFSRKRDIFSQDRKWERGDLSQEIHGKMTCSIWYVPRQLPKKWSYTAKIHLKVIDILDPHPRKSSSSSLYFHGDLYRGFHILLSNEKKQET